MWSYCYVRISLTGNSEEYYALCIAPFCLYFDRENLLYYMCTESQLGKYRLEYINNFSHSFDLTLCWKQVALCHFANDVRTDYGSYGANECLKKFNCGRSYKRFFYTNSIEHLENIRYNIEKYDCYKSYINGYVSARDYPIFNFRMVNYYDSVIQWYVHKNLYEYENNIVFITLRAMVFQFDNDSIDMTFYIILHEKEYNNVFDIRKVYVSFDRSRMEKSINKSDETSKKNV